MRGAKSNYLWRCCSFGAALAMALATGQAHAGTLPGDVQIAVVTPLSFIQVENLDFGQVIAGTTAGTITISTANVRTATGGAIPVGSYYQRAKFAGMGTQNQRVNISLAPATITLTGPGVPMTVTNLTIGPDGTLNQLGASPNYRIVAANGIFWFNVGGRLNVGANQAAGSYSGTFTATLVYQ
jgi:spore coat protein U-like protein